ncbi:hypothetical protein HT031_004477 [Scenedesmus sp. PABB004]|nr:hypothetical protein HT031_004477 [Scenedesmus sp. PABB004]
MEPGDAGASPFARLPAEVLPRVLAKLGVPDCLGAAALVCRAWADAAATASTDVCIDFGWGERAAQRTAALNRWLARHGRGVASLDAMGGACNKVPLELPLPLPQLCSLTFGGMAVALRGDGGGGGGGNALPALTRLDIGFDPFPTSLLCPGLRELRLFSCGGALFDEVLAALPCMPELTKLEFDGHALASAALSAAAALTGLRHLVLDVDDDAPGPTHVPPLPPRSRTWAFTPLTRLTALRLSLWEGGDSATSSALLRVLPCLARLQELDLGFGRHRVLAGCAESASIIASLTQLTCLKLFGGDLAPGAVARLFARALPSLRELTIHCGRGAASGVRLAQAELDALVAACPGLRQLELWAAFNPGVSCARLGLLSELRFLHLFGDCVSDDDVAHLARALTALEHLVLSGAPLLGAAGVVSLVHAARLTGLRVAQCGVNAHDDDGDDDDDEGHGRMDVIHLGFCKPQERAAPFVRQLLGLCCRNAALYKALLAHALPEHVALCDALGAKMQELAAAQDQGLTVVKELTAELAAWQALRAELQQVVPAADLG